MSTRSSVYTACGIIAAAVVTATVGCHNSDDKRNRDQLASPLQSPPSILLVTLDTTRADAVGPDARGVETPAFNAIVKRGRRFTQAYATVPQTLPSHTSMMTGLYPAGHGVHENARFVPASQPLLAEKLRAAGYDTAAFVSGFPLARRFGLARGFDHYDDEPDRGRAERSARATTERALSFLQTKRDKPLFVWAHYFDPHEPYEPPEPYRSRYADRYRGEVAAMDEQLGRLLQMFEARGNAAIIIAADHGESLGEHGEAEHGKLLYQAVMRVPLVIAGPGVAAGSVEQPVSVRRIFHTILDWAGLGADLSLRSGSSEVVLGEAMEPFLQYGWQPQVMSIDGRQKVILAGKTEIYDVIADPAESRNLSATASVSRASRKALQEYPLPSTSPPAASGALSDEDRKTLASLGYLTSDTRPVIRKDAPRPRDMAHLFEEMDRASTLFVQEDFRAAIPMFERILERDPHNLAIALRLAASHSRLGHNREALAAFARAQQIAPGSGDVRHYLALHHARSSDWERAVPLLEQVLRETPDRLPALEALAQLRERQGRFGDALRLYEKIHALRPPTGAELARRGILAMRVGDTKTAVEALEEARRVQGLDFSHELELGVLYLSMRRFTDARASLDRVSPSDPAYAMALFKRAQVSVLLGEPDSEARIARARRHADETTASLIAREKLFQQTQ